MINLLPCRALCAGLVVMGLSGAAMAATTPGTGLGQAWPNARDLSASRHWHVYMFGNGGVQYVQVNDLYGNVRVVFADINGQFLVLPMGRDARRISTPQQSASTSATAVPLTPYAETVFRDGTLQLNAVPMSDGTTMFTAGPDTTTAATTPCDDPEECSSHSP
ncbi:hypothetical protein [Frateuria terrea]|uniref:Uncharacterized protein n=1 Tax=Frateuria terrea TaxID=529704 RepID=A0A1H6S6A9_9GAMM|nr:hypothetical protein [Frateuria terrea]SEI60337.1 hypothetical protein SAMN04487997_1154 [Frateuria terrea]SFP22105.1 hypothetical protein SAMN02927913_1069 [Frateuria terrea]